MNLGPAEILVILVVALIVFGPKRLPEVGRQVGAAMRELRKMQHSVRSELDQVIHFDTEPDPAPPSEQVATAAAIEDANHGVPPELSLPDAEPSDRGSSDGPDDGFPLPRSFS